MASGSPWDRSDQFFVSKKRKAVSPVSKSGRSEKGGRNTVNSSPNAKGTLDSYLVSSQENCSAAILSYTTSDSLARVDAVKRSLEPVINSSFDNEHKQPVQAAQFQYSHATQKGLTNDLSKVSDAAVEKSDRKSCSDCRQGVENLELKQFAVDFLSSYCSEIHTNINSPSEVKLEGSKRHDALTLPEEKSTLPQKCNGSGSEMHSGEENLFFGDKNLDDMNPDAVGNSSTSVSGINTQVYSGDDVNAPDRSFRRCNYAPKSSVNMNKCFTPGSLIVKECIKETPKSTCGSSMLSPEEAFWNEAIQLADSLCASRTNNSFESSGDNNMVEGRVCMKNSCNLQDNEGKPSKILHQSQIRIENLERGTPLRLVGLYGKDSVKDVSSLPVKHFDFSFDDANLDESSPQRGAGDLISITHEAHRQYEVSSVNNEKVKFNKNFTIVGTAHTNEMMNEVHVMASVHAGSKKVNLPSRNDDNLTSNTAHSHSSDEIGTPSSYVPLNDHLDLNRWLPPEICSIYRKKGISKLYD